MAPSPHRPEPAPHRPIERPTRPRRRQSARVHAEEKLKFRSNIDDALVDYVFDREGFYENLADRLLEQVPLRHRYTRNHWLCVQLNSLAEHLDPETYRQPLGTALHRGLLHLGAPPFMANVLGAGSSYGLKVVLGLTPIGDLSKALRVLIALVCPNLGRCPAEGKVFTTFMGSLMAETLKSMADGGTLAPRTP